MKTLYMKSINVGFIAPLQLVRGVLTILSDMPTIYDTFQVKTVRNQNNKHQQKHFWLQTMWQFFQNIPHQTKQLFDDFGGFLPSCFSICLACLDWSLSKGKDTKTRNKSNRNCACINVQYHPIPLHRFYRDKDNSLQDSKGLTLV